MHRRAAGLFPLVLKRPEREVSGVGGTLGALTRNRLLSAAPANTGRSTAAVDILALPTTVSFFFTV
jgi:hypothetical protein